MSKLIIDNFLAGILFYGYYLFGDDDRLHFSTVVFSALVLNELFMVLVVVQRLTIAMIIGEVSLINKH